MSEIDNLIAALNTESPAESRNPTRDQVLVLEREIQKLPQADCPVWHFFAPGVYARKMLIRQGVLLTGAVHRSEHLCIVSGDIEVTTDEGVRRITDQQAIFSSKPGAKRAGYAYQDTLWTTVHATTETDLDKLMIEITESTNEEMLGGRDNVQLRVSADRDDYARFLMEYGLTQDIVTLLVENRADQIPMPNGIDSIELRDSLIAGQGMFATRDIAAGEFIAPARLSCKRTPAGRYINHSCRPNVRFVALPNGDLIVEAKEVIRAAQEVVIDYRQAMQVNGSGFVPVGDQA